MRKVATAAAFLALAVSVTAMPPLPRKSPEFTIVEPSGKQTLLSSLKGKVVLLSFVSTTCPHCQRASQTFTKLYKEMGPRGFQAIGVTFNENAAVLTSGFVQQFGIGYPVGYSKPDSVMSYLGLSIVDNWFVPQIVVIDRKGMIREQSPAKTDPNLQDENYLRKLIDSLLKEGATTSSTRKASTAPKKTS